MSKEEKFDSSIKGTKNPSVLTPPPYEPQMIRHVMTIHVKLLFLEAMMIV